MTDEVGNRSTVRVIMEFWIEVVDPVSVSASALHASTSEDGTVTPKTPPLSIEALAASQVHTTAVQAVAAVQERFGFKLGVTGVLRQEAAEDGSFPEIQLEGRATGPRPDGT